MPTTLLEMWNMATPFAKFMVCFWFSLPALAGLAYKLTELLWGEDWFVR